VNNKYVRGPSGICWMDFFMRLDVGDAVAARLVDLPARLPALRDCLGMIRLPDAEPGSQCHTPYACEFWDRCTADKPADWINHLPRLSQSRASELKAHGIESIFRSHRSRSSSGTLRLAESPISRLTSDVFSMLSGRRLAISTSKQ